MGIFDCITMLLDEGGASRRDAASPLPHKGEALEATDYRLIEQIIDRCLHSGLNTIGVLSRHSATHLRRHIGGLFSQAGGASIHVLPPLSGHVPSASAIYNHVSFIDQYAPKNVVILTGDAHYGIDYKEMLFHHVETRASATIASIPVAWGQSTGYGIITTDSNTQITAINQKPSAHAGLLASIGVYMFKWNVLKGHLIWDNYSMNTGHDFARDILPKMLDIGEMMVTYPIDYRQAGELAAEHK